MFKKWKFKKENLFVGSGKYRSSFEHRSFFMFLISDSFYLSTAPFSVMTRDIKINLNPVWNKQIMLSIPDNIPPLKVADIDAKIPERLTTKQLLFKNIDYALDLFLIYVLTLSIFSGFLYENTGKHHLGSWSCFGDDTGNTHIKRVYVKMLICGWLVY